MSKAIRIANCSGFYGDRLSAAREMVEGGPIDVLTGDWLAELTMLILAKNRMKDANTGFAKTFVKQMEEVMGQCLEKGIKVVTNAGGLNPQGCAAAIKAIAMAQGLNPKIAWIGGDDLMGRLGDLKGQGQEFLNIDTGEPLGDREMLTANAYLGGWGIVEALNRGADIVITGRTTDAAVVAGPAAWHHGWKHDDYNALAGAVAAGHIIECGPQAVGGNYAFFKEVPDLSHPGFPIAEIEADGSFVITKHESHGGMVSVGTVTAQLLYEIGAPAYLNPDVVTRFDTIELTQEAPNRVRATGIQGEAPPDSLKVSMNHVGGYRGGSVIVVTGLDAEQKAELYLKALWAKFPQGKDTFESTHVELIRGNRADPANNEEHVSMLRIVVMDPDQSKVGKQFFAASTELALGNIPGLCGIPGVQTTMYGVCWPTTVSAELVPQQVHIDDEVISIESKLDLADEGAVQAQRPELPPAPEGETRLVPLGRLFGARSGDKAGNANLGVWARSPEAYAWLEKNLTLEKLAQLMPEAVTHEVKRYELPNIYSLNFVFIGLLGRGVAASPRMDAQAKGLGEYLRALHMDIPVSLLD